MRLTLSMTIPPVLGSERVRPIKLKSVLILIEELIPTLVFQLSVRPKTLE